MAALTNTGLFGAKGASCDSQVMKMVEISREFDFGVTNVAEDTNYDILPIPAGFLATNIAVKQTGATDQDVTVTFATKNDATTAVGGNFALKDLTGETALCCDCQNVGALAGTVASTTATITGSFSKFFGSADTLCLKVPDSLTNDKLAKGKIRVSLIGYQVFGSSLLDVASGTPAWTTGQTTAQANANVSGGDPMFN